MDRLGPIRLRTFLGRACGEPAMLAVSQEDLIVGSTSDPRGFHRHHLTSPITADDQRQVRHKLRERNR